MSIKSLVNDKNMWDSLNKELDSRISFYHKQMEILTGIEDLYRLQGEIKSLRSLKSLRDKINGQQADKF